MDLYHFKDGSGQEFGVTITMQRSTLDPHDSAVSIVGSTTAFCTVLLSQNGRLRMQQACNPFDRC
jgi:hypothetical protein